MNSKNRILGWLAGAMLCGMAGGITPAHSQNYQPPFPRLVFQRPGGISGGAIEHFLARYNFVVHGGGLDVYHQTADLNTAVRRLNPDVLILGTSRQGVWPMNPLWPSQCFLYSDYYATLADTARPGDRTIRVSTTQKLAANFNLGDVYALLGGDNWIMFSGYTDSTLTGIPASGDGAITRIHPPGDSLKRPVRFSGFGYVHNITSFAAPVDSQAVWQYFIDVRFNPTKQDFSVFDGVFYDAFRFNFWSTDFYCGVDLDHDHVGDFDEHGIDWFNAQWAEGVKQMLPYEKSKFQDLHPGKPPLMVINTGTAQEGDPYPMRYCDGMMWEGFMRFAYTAPELIRINQEWEAAHDTVFTIIEDYVDPVLRPMGKNDFTYMRFGLTAALVSGAYYGRTWGNEYSISLFYDEFETHLGYPLGPGREIPGKPNVFARFFDKGAAICNASGSPVTVTEADLEMVPGYQGRYYRFLGNQAILVNNGEPFTSVSLYGETRTPPRKNKGDGIVLLSFPDTVVTDIIVGNCLNNDTSPGSDPVSFSGGYWGPVYDRSYETKPFANRNPCYSQWGANSGAEAVGYHYSHKREGLGTAKYVPTINLPGYYEIYEWHPMVGETPEAYREASDVPFEVWVNNERKIAGIIDQTRGYGQWNRIATLYLPAGNHAYLTLSNNCNGYMAADAMRFHYLKRAKPDLVPPRRPEQARFRR